MTEVHSAVVRVAAGANPFTTLESIQEGGILGPIFRFAVGQLVGHAVNKGIDKGMKAGAQKYDDIMKDAAKEAPIQTITKLHTMANHPSTKGTPEGKNAARRMAIMSKQHNITIGPSGPVIDKGAVIGKALGKQAVNKNTWQDAMDAFKQGKEGK